MARIFHAFPDREDVGVGGPHLRVDQDRPADLEPRLPGEPGRRADADRHHHEVGGQFGPVFQLDMGDMAVAVDGLGGCLRHHRDAAPFQVLLQQVARRRVELPVHQVARQVQHRHLHAAEAQARGGLQA